MNGESTEAVFTFFLVFFSPADSKQTRQPKLSTVVGSSSIGKRPLVGTPTISLPYHPRQVAMQTPALKLLPTFKSARGKVDVSRSGAA